MPGKGLRATFAIVLIALAASMLGSLPAAATTPPKRCGEITVGERDFAVRGHLMECRVARRQSRRFLSSGEHPAGFSCTRYPASVTRIAFTCRKGQRDYYAIRT